MDKAAKIQGLATLLVRKRIVEAADAVSLVEQARTSKRNFISLLLEQEYVSGKALQQMLGDEYGIATLDLDSVALDEIADEYRNESLIRKHHALPLYVQHGVLLVAVDDPVNISALEDFQFNLGRRTEAVLVEHDKLAKAIDKLLDTGFDDIDLGDISDDELAGMEVQDTEAQDDDATDDSDDAPIVIYINKLLMDAIRKGASDLHFEPYEKRYRVRFRIDGILHEVASPPISMSGRLAARLKVMASLDIAERRVPQDGRIKLRISRSKSIDFRVSTLPTLWGEKVVMRILDSSSAQLGIDLLGYEQAQKELFINALNQPQGMILVTGPTGSGKTVSLYTGLNILNTEERNIATAEDPVEINLSGINQVQINTRAGLDFSSALRAFLRQDPDVVMVGEIRDLETAEIAIKASQTGHLVLSTLHTNSAAETLTRLLNMGVPAYNIASSVTLVIAQRLARRLCPKCKRPHDLPPHALLSEGFTQDEIDQGLDIFEAVGCDDCTGGYKGRVGIYEVMPMSDDIARLIVEGGNSLQIADQMQIEGVHNLRQSALNKVKQGVTSLVEASRVTSF
ncbi:type IV-A pilus assembly ATPase PilB [Echinimonas agarilytica]|uniref:Type IV-A pilus assembly ATPase PilB n=1 Tax=Echinimonas agarilytica TaxID=1215918 RepID=A0AA41W4P0_9GAMM|nr:type IV-A pilus assembly ATPase PilB [Echinimonas agarilytica]MCM2678795.1 type IV-A pilus assembly ATPase PilB [Echinimonas agarilytica]